MKNGNLIALLLTVWQFDTVSHVSNDYETGCRWTDFFSSSLNLISLFSPLKVQIYEYNVKFKQKSVILQKEMVCQFAKKKRKINFKKPQTKNPPK